jgi:hypothetical protein
VSEARSSTEELPLKLVRNILIVAIVLVVLALVSLNWILPAAMAFYAAKRAPAITRVVPQPLTDGSISNAPGRKLSYLGYEFEVPWTDLDDNATLLLPKGATSPNRLDLRFRSGLRLVVTALPPREWTTEVARETKWSPKQMEALFGPATENSDYQVLSTIYEFSPQKMNHWKATEHGVSKDELLLILKSIVPLKAAESGIFYLQNEQLKGFQEGTPSPQQDVLAVHMFGDHGSVEMMFFQMNYKDPERVRQAEINRIVRSLREVAKDKTKASETSLPSQASQSKIRN